MPLPRKESNKQKNIQPKKEEATNKQTKENKIKTTSIYHQLMSTYIFF